MMLAQWLEDLQSTNDDVCSAALQHLQQLGPEAPSAVPTLLAELEKVRDKPQQASRIALGLGAIGPDARDAVPLLASLVSPDGVRWRSIHPVVGAFPLAILQIGGEPAQERLALCSLLRSSEGGGWDVYPFSLWYWKEAELMRSRADRIIPRLAELLTDADAYVRSRAAETLTPYGPWAAAAVPALRAALNDPSPGARRQIALALLAVEPGHKSEVIAALAPLLSHPEVVSDFYLRRDVCDTLGQLGEDVVAHLLPLLRQHTGDAQWPFVQCLQALGEPSVPALRQELRGPSVAGRVGAARVLGKLASKAQAAFEDLVAVLQDPEAEVRDEAAEALVEIDALGAGPALPTLIARLDSPDATVRGKVAKLVARMGATAEPALPALAKLLTDSEMRLEVVKLLAQMGPAAEPALPALSKLLTDPEMRLEAALAMVMVASNARQAVVAVPVLVEALKRCDPASPVSDRAQELLEALGRIGTPAAEAAPLIRQFLPRHSIWGYVSIRAAAVLARVAPEQQADAVNKLLPMVADAENQPDDFWEALAALAAIGPAARAVVPQLEVLLFDEEKRALLDAFCPGDSVALLFSALVQIDATAAARLLKDPRAAGQWDSLGKALGELGPAARPLVPVLQDLLTETTPEKAEPLKALLARIK